MIPSFFTFWNDNRGILEPHRGSLDYLKQLAFLFFFPFFQRKIWSFRAILNHFESETVNFARSKELNRVELGRWESPF